MRLIPSRARSLALRWLNDEQDHGYAHGGKVHFMVVFTGSVHNDATALKSSFCSLATLRYETIRA
jgi:hypothetical protein